MNTKPIRDKSRELFNVDYVPQRVNQHNQRAWTRAVLQLGQKWKLHPANHVERVQ